jgi:heat shock protein HslJ
MQEKSKTILALAGIVVFVLFLYYFGGRNTVLTPINEVPSGKLPAGSTPIAGKDALEGNTYVWQGTLMNDDTSITPKQSGKFTISFGTDGKATGKTDCNSYFTSYNVGTDGAIKFQNIGATKMYCEGAQESVFLRDLGLSSNYMVTETGELVLMLPYDSGVMIFAKQ